MKFNIKLSLIISILAVCLLFFTACTDVGQNACTEEAKICPDGSSVGREGPNCDFAACPIVKNNNGENNQEQNELNLGYNDDSLKKFSSKKDLLKYILEEEMNSVGSSSRSFGRGDMALAQMAVDDFADADISGVAVAKNSEESGGSSSDYSKTNVQVEGVDEADIVKNDGKYIYTLSQNKLVTVLAYPAEDLKVVSTVKFEDEGNPQELFLYEDKVVVFLNSYESVKKVSSYDFTLRNSYESFTKILVYDFSDKSKPKILNEYTVDGNYLDSRLIGDDVYFISKESFYYYGDDWEFPVLRMDGDILIEPSVYYFGNPEGNYNMHIVASFSLDNDEKKVDVNAKTFMLGYSNTLYFSENNIYISYRKNMPYWYYDQESMEGFFEVVVPILPLEYKEKFENFKNTEFDSIRSQREMIVEILDEMYSSLSDKERDKLEKEVREVLSDYKEKKAIERDRTIVHKIAIDDGDIEYVAKGEVQGHLLNQFSLDENNDEELRLATTTSVWTSDGSKSFSNVVILDSKMEKIGEISGLAEGERIYSTRFMGDKLYMVTFKQIDPLFVIDLSDSENPKVLGELKIPGFSNYLHPYDDNYLIGIGKDTKESKWGGITTNGVKLSLFDISDFENPKEVDNYVIEGQWTDSIALHEHKAFLFDKKKNILVMPVREYIGEVDNYRYKYWQGAYVFEFNDDLNFELKGKVSHEENEEGNSYWYRSPSAVLRSLYMDDVLYTVSEKTIVANDLNDNLKEIDSVSLKYKDNEYNYPYYY
ncbi:MAG: beta-propeller domain-containing protein [Nanoarchaeota archaeon]|nr:beta-propeller domain-containing protein [Nanoarchaeota archaeon]